MNQDSKFTSTEINLGEGTGFIYKKKNQTNQIKSEILKQLELGQIDKQEIYSKVVELLNVPRPTVRRVAKDLILDLEDKIKILKKEYTFQNV